MSPVSEPAIQDLAPHGRLRAGINERNPVLVSTRAPDGQPDGVAPALAAELARRLGVPVDLVGSPSPGAVADRAGAGEWDIALLGADPARATAMDFTAPYAELPASFLAHTASGITRLPDADQPGRTIVATRSSAYTLWLEGHLVHADLVQPASPEEAREIFAAGPRHLLAGLASSLSEEALRVPGSTVLRGSFTAVQQAIACPPGRPAGLSYLQAFVTDAVESGLVAELIRRYGVGAALSVAPVTRSLRTDHGQGERLVAGRVRHGLVDVVQAELGDLVLAQVEQAGPGQGDEPGGRRAREHPLAADGDAVAHQPRVGQGQVVPAQHADAAHEHHPAEFAHGHDGGPGRGRARLRWQHVQHHVDRAVSGGAHPLLVFPGVAGQPGGPDPVPVAAGQVVEHGLVTAGDAPAPPLTGAAPPACGPTAVGPPYGTSSRSSAHQRPASASSMGPSGMAFSVGIIIWLADAPC